jgi:pyruvate kinase
MQSYVMRHTKIIATVGPASQTDDMLDALIAADTDIVRLYFSHGTPQSHAATFPRIRASAERALREVAVLQDLRGQELVARGLVAAGAAVVLVSINADLARPDANYLKILRL